MLQALAPTEADYGANDFSDVEWTRMAWAKPQFSRGRVDAAGKAIISLHKADPFAIDDALTIINNWRSSHSYPLQVLKMTLSQRAKKIDPSTIIAQRLKRLASIRAKLRRFPNMKLSQVQDLGGCRAVLSTIEHVHDLAAAYGANRTTNPHGRPECIEQYDYISQPKRDGYRGIHYVYKYRTKAIDRKIYDGLRIEIQVRSQLQHAWATAVETVGTFTQQALKSHQGDGEWLRFFALMGAALAYRENTCPVPNTPINKPDLLAEIRHYAKLLNVMNCLLSYSVTISTSEKIRGIRDDATYYLLELEGKPDLESLSIYAFLNQDLEAASQAYAKVERRIADRPEVDAVLVSVESMEALRRAYPNYFLDTQVFSDVLEQVLAGDF